MAKAADIGSKRLISLAPDAWLSWVTGLTGVTAREMLSSDFQWLNREGDVLQKTFHPDPNYLVAFRTHPPGWWRGIDVAKSGNSPPGTGATKRT